MYIGWDNSARATLELHLLCVGNAVTDSLKGVMCIYGRTHPVPSKQQKKLSKKNVEQESYNFKLNMLGDY
jgi:hypothetical protein